MKKVALLLDSSENEYQKLLVQSALDRAAQLGIEILGPAYAGGSSFTQLDQLLSFTREAGAVDAIVVSVAGTASDLPAAKRTCRGGVSMVYLNRIPEHLAELRAAFPEVLVTGVTPDQEAVGRIQAAQCARLAPEGGFVVMITGVRTSASAQRRERGFLAAAGSRVQCHAIDGRWTADGASKVLVDWFRLGADRKREIAIVVCHNDQMALGARRALAQQARETGTPSLLDVPIVGCDGLPAEGQRMVRDGEIVATVVIPPTTPGALDRLAAFWAKGDNPEVTVLAPESFPSLEKLTSPSRR